MGKRDKGDIDRAAWVPGDPVAVTPADAAIDANNRFFYAGLFVGTGGNISVRGRDNTTDVIFYNVANGTFLPIAVCRVNSTNTTASNIVGFKTPT